MFGSSGILKDDVIEKLASVGPILNLAGLERIVGPQWPWFGKYGDELLTKLLAMSIPPMVPKPTQQKPAKRPLDEGVIQREVSKSIPVVNAERNNKRVRTEATISTHHGKAPTGVTPTMSAAQPRLSTTIPVSFEHQPPSENRLQPQPLQAQQYTSYPIHFHPHHMYNPPPPSYYTPTIPGTHTQLPFPYSQLIQTSTYSRSLNTLPSQTEPPSPYHLPFPQYPPPS